MDLTSDMWTFSPFSILKSRFSTIPTNFPGAMLFGGSPDFENSTKYYTLIEWNIEYEQRKDAI